MQFSSFMQFFFVNITTVQSVAHITFAGGCMSIAQCSS